MMKNFLSATCVVAVLALTGCATSNPVHPSGICSVDESWMNTARRCGASGTNYHTFNLPPGADCQVVEGEFEYSYSRVSSVPEIAQYRAVTGSVTFFFATNLVDISGLRNLEHVGWLTLRSIPTPDVRALSNLRVVTNALGIGDMQALTSLEGLERLRSVGGDLQIIGNPQLTSLRGLESLCSVGGNLQIYDNPLLPQSEVQALLERITVGGELTLMNPIDP